MESHAIETFKNGKGEDVEAFINEAIKRDEGVHSLEEVKTSAEKALYK